MSWSPRRIASRGGARSGRGGEALRLGDLEDTMTTEQKIIRAKVGLLELAKVGELRVQQPRPFGNVEITPAARDAASEAA